MDERERLIARVIEKEGRLQRALLVCADNPLLSVGLTMQQLKALLVLTFGESASGRDLSRALGVGLATVTGIVDRLAAQGLVERRDDPHDRRVRRVFITEDGERVVDKVIGAGLEQRRRLLRKLDTAALRSVEDAQGKLLDAIDETDREGIVPRAVHAG